MRDINGALWRSLLLTANAIASGAVATLLLEVSWDEDRREFLEDHGPSLVLQWVIVGLTIAMQAQLVEFYWHLYSVKLAAIEDERRRGGPRLTKPLKWWLLPVEMAVCVLMPLPSGALGLSEKAALLVFLRLYHIVRVAHRSSLIYRLRPHILAVSGSSVGAATRSSVARVQFDVLLSIKSLFTSQPVVFISVVLAATYLPLALGVYVQERDADDSDYWTLSTSLYYIAAVMSTVGADAEPRNPWARLLTLAAFFVGVTLTSLAVVVISRTLELSDAESLVYEMATSFQSRIRAARRRADGQAAKAAAETAGRPAAAGSCTEAMRSAMLALAAIATQAIAAAAGSCSYCTPASAGNHLSYDLSGLPSGAFTLADGSSDKYFVQSPCGTFVPPKAECSSVEFEASAYQANSAYGCIPLGNASRAEGQPLSWADEGAGLHLVQRGGSNHPECNGGRVIVYRGVCDKDAPASNPPNETVVESPRCTYTVLWSNPAFCPVRSPGTCPDGPQALPKPTPEQLHWQRDEIGGLTHFNMATFALVDGDPACRASNWNVAENTSNPNTFAPTNLNVSNWVESYKALGAGYAVLTAKHGCGFLLFDTKSKLPARLGGGDYNYGVKRSGVPSYPRDVADEFVTTLRAAGLGTGFYYSTTNNFFTGYVQGKQLSPLLPGQLNVTSDEFNDIVFQQLGELWGNYGAFTEVWLDHGYTPAQQSRLQMLLLDKQPTAMGFNGLGVSTNPCRWVGTEGGDPTYPIWSTGTDGTGDPTSPVWNPAVADTTLQLHDSWFFLKDDGIRTLTSLVDVYHATVGANTVLELDFAIDTTGNVHPSHAAAYKALGDWVRTCYGTPVAGTAGSGGVFNLTMPGGSAAVDRVIIGEDQTYGQRIREFTVDALGPDGKWTVLSTGSSVGHKRIAIAKAAVTASVVRLTVTGATAQPILTGFAAYAPCAPIE